jgi:cyclophilin family peptidyl-prolyl cis-trans isomerase
MFPGLRLLMGALLLTAASASAGTYVQFRTVWGDIDVELYDQDKPNTVNNFLRYVQSGRYQNLFFHRCPTNPVTRLTDFVVQGGGYVVTPDPAIVTVPIFGTISNEFGVGRRFTNVYGTLAMAKVAGDTNSASSQWFFNLNNNVFLDAPNADGYFTVFGHVVRGSNVLNQYLGRSLNNGIQNLAIPFDTLPVIYSGTNPPTYSQLEYVDISLLSVQVTNVGLGREISWKSILNRTNRIEFTTNLPPVWNVLFATNGTGGRVVYVDPAANAPRRFYRVRVDF